MKKVLNKLLMKVKLYKEKSFKSGGSRQNFVDPDNVDYRQEAYPDFTIIEDIDDYRSEFTARDMFIYEAAAEEYYEVIQDFSRISHQQYFTTNPCHSYCHTDDDYEIIEYKPESF